MDVKDYSMGLVKYPFWFSEERKIIELLADGMSLTDIKKKNQAENLFGAPSALRRDQIFNHLSSRISAMEGPFVSLFLKEDVAGQRLLVLASIMNWDRMFFEFVYYVVREKMITGLHELTEKDFGMFFRDVQTKSERAAKWQEKTLRRMAGAYRTFLSEGGLLERAAGKKTIRKVFVDPDIEEYLDGNGMTAIRKALEGER